MEVQELEHRISSKAAMLITIVWFFKPPGWFSYCSFPPRFLAMACRDEQFLTDVLVSPLRGQQALIVNSLHCTALWFPCFFSMDYLHQTCSKFSPQLPLLFLLYFCLGDLIHFYDFQNHLYSGDSHSYFFLSFLFSAPNLYILLAYLNVSEEFLKFAFWKQDPFILYRKSYISVSIFKINGAITNHCRS